MVKLQSGVNVVLAIGGRNDEKMVTVYHINEDRWESRTDLELPKGVLSPKSMLSISKYSFLGYYL